VVTGTILAQGTPAIDANDNSPNELDIPPGSTGTPANGTLTVDPLVEGSVAIIQARATADKVAGIKATSGGGPGAVVSSAKATGIAASVGLPPDSDLMSAGHAITATTNGANATGLFARSEGGPGIEAFSQDNSAIKATSESGPGITAASTSGPGARISSQQATGLAVAVGLPFDVGLGEALLETVGHAIAAITHTPNAAGLFTRSENGAGVDAASKNGPGILASGNSFGVDASSAQGTAVRARSRAGVGLSVEGRLEVGDPAIGAVTAAGGETSLQVHSAAATDKSTILLTPLSNPGAFLWINARAAGVFTIGASQPLPRGLIIQYLIIN